MTSIRVRLRRGTSAQWSSANPVLASGEAGFETDTNVLKIGDGVTAYNSLTAIGGSGGGANLTWTASTRTVASDSGTDAVITLADGTDAGLMSSSDFTKLAAISGTNTGDQSVILRVPFHTAADSNVTLTNQANAEQFLGNSNRNITMADLSGFTEYRLLARVVTGSASANSPRLYAEYHTSFTTTVGTYSTLGTSVVSVSLTTAGHVATAWTALAAGAIADGIFLTVLQNGGDAAADPAVAQVVLEFR